MENLEQEAIRRILAGDKDEYRVLVDSHLPAVLRMTFRVTGNLQDAEEVAQQAFLQAYNKLPEFRNEAAFGTWVYRIAMNCSLNLVKRRNCDLAWNAIPLDTTPDTRDRLVSNYPTPETALLEAEARRRRESAMNKLTPMERTAFILRHLEEQDVDIIASALGVSANSARQTIFRAATKLRRELAPSKAIAAQQYPSRPLGGFEDVL